MSDLKEMELRLERIEKAIATLAKPRGPAALSEEDVAAYHRVRSVLWDDGTCGINETSPCVITCRIIDKICHVIPIGPWPCYVPEINPCAPCLVTDIGIQRGGGGRFGGFGR